jgi:hypothetical protein
LYRVFFSSLKNSQAIENNKINPLVQIPFRFTKNNKKWTRIAMATGMFEWLFNISSGQKFRTREERQDDSTFFFGMNGISVLIIVIVFLCMLLFYVFRTMKDQLLLMECELKQRPTFQQVSGFVTSTLVNHRLIPIPTQSAPAAGAEAGAAV